MWNSADQYYILSFFSDSHIVDIIKHEVSVYVWSISYLVQNHTKNHTESEVHVYSLKKICARANGQTVYILLNYSIWYFFPNEKNNISQQFILNREDHLSSLQNIQSFTSHGDQNGGVCIVYKYIFSDKNV